LRTRLRNSSGLGGHIVKKTDSRLKALARDPLHQRAYEELRNALMAGRFAPGEKLKIRETAERMQISTMPVRAAFSRLVAERAVSQASTGSIVIPTMTSDQVGELMTLRAHLEGMATERATPLLTEADLRGLEKLVEKTINAAANKDSAGYLRNNQNFKFTIYKAAQMPGLFDLIERLWLQIGPFMSHYARGMPYPLSKDTHKQEILAALKRRDPIEARKALEKDVLYGMDFLKKIAEEIAARERA